MTYFALMYEEDYYYHHVMGIYWDRRDLERAMGLYLLEDGTLFFEHFWVKEVEIETEKAKERPVKIYATIESDDDEYTQEAIKFFVDTGDFELDREKISVHDFNAEMKKQGNTKYRWIRDDIPVNGFSIHF